MKSKTLVGLSIIFLLFSFVLLAGKENSVNRTSERIDGNYLSEIEIEYAVFPSRFNLTSLDGNNGFIINGINLGDMSGDSVSNAGDINGDGIDDCLIGAPSAKNEAGQTYIIFGSKQKWPPKIDLNKLNGNNGFIINGLNKTDNLGFSTAGVGDINGDGIADILISAPRKDNTTYGEGYAVFGSKQKWSSTFSLANLNGNNGFIIKHSNKKSIAVMSAAGDINGDGIDDFLISGDISFGIGQSYVVFGSKQKWPKFIDLAKLDGTNGFIINGIKGQGKGFSISAGGDINGDGIDDILIGDGDFDSSLGQTYVLFGSKQKWSTIIYLEDLNGNNGFTINGIEEYSYSGAAVSGVGDINGDQIDDILIGAYEAYDGGRSYIIFGSKEKWPPIINLKDLTGSNGFVMNGTSGSGWCGYSVSGAGDINGDNLNDFLIGAPHANANFKGESYVVYGSKQQWPRIINLAALNGKDGFAIIGIHQGDWLGYSVSNAGDINGDGKEDVLIAAPRANNEAGQSYVIFGQ